MASLSAYQALNTIPITKQHLKSGVLETAFVLQHLSRPQVYDWLNQVSLNRITFSPPDTAGNEEVYERVYADSFPLAEAPYVPDALRVAVTYNGEAVMIVSVFPSEHELDIEGLYSVSYVFTGIAKTRSGMGDFQDNFIFQSSVSPTGALTEDPVVKFADKMADHISGILQRYYTRFHTRRA